MIIKRNHNGANAISSNFIKYINKQNKNVVNYRNLKQAQKETYDIQGHYLYVTADWCEEVTKRNICLLSFSEFQFTNQRIHLQISQRK